MPKLRPVRGFQAAHDQDILAYLLDTAHPTRRGPANSGMSELPYVLRCNAMIDAKRTETKNVAVGAPSPAPRIIVDLNDFGVGDRKDHVYGNVIP